LTQGGLERLRWVLVAGIAAVGLLQLATPFTGDQALFTVFARQLNQGDHLYTDLWDVKQPGLFWWYAAAGALGGYQEVSVHLFEVVWLTGFAAWMPRLMRGHLSSRRAEVLAPALSIGAFLLVAEAADLTQAEVIGGPVVFLGALCAATARADQRRRLLLAGLLVGAAAAIKLTLAPLAAVALLVPIFFGPPDVSRLRRAGPVVLWAGLGFAAALAAVAAYLALTGALGEALDTWVGFAPSTTAAAGRPLGRLGSSVARAAVMYAPVWLLALAGATRLLPGRWSNGPPRVPVAMAAWAVVAVPMFLVQHWWAYLLQMVVIPLGVLAAVGVDVVAGWTEGRVARRRLAVGAVAVGAVLMVGFAAPKWLLLGGNGFGVTQGGRQAIQEEISPAYSRGRALNDAVGVPGDAFVLADPVVLWQTGRDQGVPTNGWSPEQLDAEHWARLGRELEEHRPPLIVIDPPSLELVTERAPATLEVIDAGWCQVGGVDGERWYLRRDLGECPG
jgi:hypothetical protein